MHETLHCQLGLPLRPCGSEIVSLTHSLTPPLRLSLPQLPLFMVSASHLVYAPEVPPRGERAPRPCLPDRQSLGFWEPTSPLHPASAPKACLSSYTHTQPRCRGVCVESVPHTVVLQVSSPVTNFPRVGFPVPSGRPARYASYPTQAMAGPSCHGRSPMEGVTSTTSSARK